VAVVSRFPQIDLSTAFRARANYVGTIDVLNVD